MENNKLTIVMPDVKTRTNNDIDVKKIFENYGNVITNEVASSDELPELFRNADIILCNKSLINKETLKYADKLKYVGITATGYNNVDLEYTNSKGIIVSNAADYSTDAVAQHTFALILGIYNRLADYDKFTKEGKWIGSETFSPFVFQMQELLNKTIGIVGFGNIGKKVADIALAFNMNVLVYSRNKERVNEELLKYEENKKIRIKYASISEICASSDIITLHCPLNKDSTEIVNSDFLSSCKKSAIIINTARGGLVNENDLKEALMNDIIAGAAIDVISNEPMLDSNPLIGCKNLIITPHVAWAPYETRFRLIKIVERNLKAFLTGNPQNVVSK